MLYGCLNCSGTDSEKAEVFHRVVQPELQHRVVIADKDIRMSVFFLTNISTVLLYMTEREVRAAEQNQQFDFQFLRQKMSMYEVVFQSVIDGFN